MAPLNGSAVERTQVGSGGAGLQGGEQGWPANTLHQLITAHPEDGSSGATPQTAHSPREVLGDFAAGRGAPGSVIAAEAIGHPLQQSLMPGQGGSDTTQPTPNRGQVTLDGSRAQAAGRQVHPHRCGATPRQEGPYRPERTGVHRRRDVSTSSHRNEIRSRPIPLQQIMSCHPGHWHHRFDRKVRLLDRLRQQRHLLRIHVRHHHVRAGVNPEIKTRQPGRLDLRHLEDRLQHRGRPPHRIHVTEHGLDTPRVGTRGHARSASARRSNRSGCASRISLVTRSPV